MIAVEVKVNDEVGANFGAHFNRIEKVLDYIHHHLDLPLTLDDLSQKSCWSRWQLQRVFSAKTGLSVAQYVREIKLSKAAELLLCSRSERIVDIAFQFGFSSEISFSRAFKQFFSCSPRAYKQRGLRTGLRQPITALMLASKANHSVGCALFDNPIDPRFIQIRIEHKPQFLIEGCRGAITGLFSLNPNFESEVPKIWQRFHQHSSCFTSPSSQTFIGVVDASRDVIEYPSLDEPQTLDYWAGMPVESLPTGSLSISTNTNVAQHSLHYFEVPTQEYVVLPHVGPISGLKHRLEWLISHWLPNSGYRGIDGIELEMYSPDYQADSPQAYMEYWLPIA